MPFHRVEIEVESLVGVIVDGRYRIEHELGRGASGTVYRARHVKLGREVAIKVLHRNHGDVPAYVERFEREAMLAARLAHRNLIGVHDVGVVGDHRFMVMELARGTSLSTILEQEHRLRVDRAIDLLIGICKGLAAAHAVGLVHRDLKPENVIVEYDGEVETPRIVDFGIAISNIGETNRRLTEQGIVFGTPRYMAPEQAKGEPLDERCDLFALGIMAYEMLAGVGPFTGSGVDVVLANISEPLPVISDRVPGLLIDARVENIVLTLTAKQPRDRFASADQARMALELVRSVMRPRRRRSSLPPLR